MSSVLQMEKEVVRDVQRALKGGGRNEHIDEILLPRQDVLRLSRSTVVEELARSDKKRMLVGT